MDHLDPTTDLENFDDAADDGDPAPSFTPAVLNRRSNGWTADRQRRFITALAETGCISSASDEVGVTARSAYRLRARPEGRAFAAAWDDALLIATNRLLTLAFERAVNGMPRSVWRDDKLVAETRQPSERLMVFLLTHLMPDRFGGQPMLNRRHDRRVAIAQQHLPRRLNAIADADCPVDPLVASDYLAQPPLAEEG